VRRVNRYLSTLPTTATVTLTGKSLATTTSESLSLLMGFKSVIGYGRHPSREPKLVGDVGGGEELQQSITMRKSSGRGAVLRESSEPPPGVADFRTFKVAQRLKKIHLRGMTQNRGVKRSVP
jgi:hypothetical protein